MGDLEDWVGSVLFAAEGAYVSDAAGMPTLPVGVKKDKDAYAAQMQFAGKKRRSASFTRPALAALTSVISRALFRGDAPDNRAWAATIAALNPVWRSYLQFCMLWATKEEMEAGVEEGRGRDLGARIVALIRHHQVPREEAYLRAVREVVGLPLLRKDFIIDARQILEAVEHGADAILLIVAILDDARLREFQALALAAGLSVLVEVHDEAELARALAVDARLLGVNNRNLKTFKVDLATTERLATEARTAAPRPDRLLVAESGIHTRADVQRVAAAGAGAILVGESLMRHADIPAKVAELLGP